MTSTYCVGCAEPPVKDGACAKCLEIIEKNKTMCHEAKLAEFLEEDEHPIMLVHGDFRIHTNPHQRFIHEHYLGGKYLTENCRVDPSLLVHGICAQMFFSPKQCPSDEKCDCHKKGILFEQFHNCQVELHWRDKKFKGYVFASRGTSVKHMSLFFIFGAVPSVVPIPQIKSDYITRWVKEAELQRTWVRIHEWQDDAAWFDRVPVVMRICRVDRSRKWPELRTFHYDTIRLPHGVALPVHIIFVDGFKVKATAKVKHIQTTEEFKGQGEWCSTIDFAIDVDQ